MGTLASGFGLASIDRGLGGGLCRLSVISWQTMLFRVTVRATFFAGAMAAIEKP